MKKEYGASNLYFAESKSSGEFTDLRNKVLSLLATETEKNDSFTGDEIDILKKIKSDIEGSSINDFIDLDYPRFSLTPHELEWLQANDQEKWSPYLIYRYKFKVYPVQGKLDSFPVHLLIEPTSICNLRCKMCFQIDRTFSSNKDFMGMMSWELFTSVVDQAADYKCNALTMASRGEPTLHKKFGEMLRYIHEKHIMDVKINTNATMLTEKLCHDILSSNVATVTLSIDSVNKDDYEKIRIGSNFDKVLRNIETFNDIRSRYYPKSLSRTRIAAVGLKDASGAEELKNFWSDYVDQVTIRKEIARWDSYGNSESCKDNICKLLYERIYVWWDGICNPCDFDYKSYLKFGDASKEPIHKIWLSDTYNALREKHVRKTRKEVVPCDRCPF